jgi:hypothetical protein
MEYVCSEKNATSGYQCGCNSRFRFICVDPETKIVFEDRERDDDFCCGRHYSKKCRVLDGAYFVTQFEPNVKQNPRLETLHAISGLATNHPNFRTAIRLINGSFPVRNWSERWRQVKQIIQLAMLDQLDRIVQYPPPVAGDAQRGPPPVARAQDPYADRDTAMSRRANTAVVVLPPPPPPPEEPPPPPPVLEDPSLPLREGETRDCSVCMTNEGTVRCGENRHVMCEGCFGDYAVAESSNPSFDGELRCCSAKAFGCKAAPFSSLSVLRRLPEDKAQAFMRGLRNSQERSNFDEFKRNKIADEQRRNALDVVEKARAHVIENILTLRCPRPGCGQAFVDFDGCMALTCSRCKAGICGKCFMQFGNDAHSHITRGECKMDSSKLVFANDTYIRNVQRVYRIDKLNAYLRTLRPETVSEVIRRCDKELRDLGIDITPR